jgi:U4/U6.U5 tri-snRNP-associated protein 2
MLKFYKSSPQRLCSEFSPSYTYIYTVTHSVDENHCVFIHLKSGKFYCLPDNYEIVDNPSLADIKLALHPRYTPAQIKALDQQMDLSRDLWGKQYLPGYVGMNNLQRTDYVNAVIQALAHVPPIRNFFLMLNSNGSNINSNGSDQLKRNSKGKPFEYSHLALSFAELMRKLWSNQRFKNNVDPHEMIQAISAASKKRFHVGTQADAAEFLPWLLHQLHLGIGGHPRKPGTSVIHKTFQGVVEVTTRQPKKVKTSTRGGEEEDDRDGSDNEDEIQRREAEREAAQAAANKLVMDESTATTNFLHLTLEIPEKPLFKDENGGLVIPQEPLVTVLQKFNGISLTDAINRQGTPQQRRYKLKKLPNYLILHLARFKKNNFYSEKNPTIVAFPLKNLDMKPYVHRESNESTKKMPTKEEIEAMSVSSLAR